MDRMNFHSAITPGTNHTELTVVREDQLVTGGADVHQQKFFAGLGLDGVLREQDQPYSK